MSAGVVLCVYRPGDPLHHLLPPVAAHGEGLQRPPLEDQQHHHIGVLLPLHGLFQSLQWRIWDQIQGQFQCQLWCQFQSGGGEPGGP